jgi:hypothetical protein
MEFLFVLARKPLFQLLAAIIVLLLTDMHPAYGIAAALVWAAWIYTAKQGFFSRLK